MDEALTLATRLAAIGEAQQASMASVNDRCSQGSLGDYLGAIDRVYTETARNLRDAKTDAIRELDEYAVVGPRSQEESATIRRALSVIDQELQIIVGVKAGVRHLHQASNLAGPCPDGPTFAAMLVASLSSVRELGAISSHVFDDISRRLTARALEA